MFEYIVLGMVLNEQRTGYDIKKEIDAGIGNFYRASYGSLYPALKKLTDKGYLTMNEQSHGSRVKKYYKATDAGATEFLKWLSVSFDPNADATVSLAKIFFFGELPDDVRNKILGEYEFYIGQGLRRLREIEECHAHLIENDRDYYEIATLYYGLLNTISSLRWIKHIKEKRPFSELLSNVCGDDA